MRYRNNNGFTYVSSGVHPKLLIHTGTHGDEYESIQLVSDCIKKYIKLLPPFIYVPQVSPSAVTAKTRFNSRGNDLNRIFYEDSTDPEVQENIKLFKKGPFNLFVSFHEDPEFSKYYIYDVGVNTEPTDLVVLHNQTLKKHGFQLLNGFDDPDDPSLGFEFTEGYRKFKYTKKENGMILVWACSQGLVKRCFLPEIPGRISLDDKRILIDSFFSQVLVKYFNP